MMQFTFFLLLLNGKSGLEPYEIDDVPFREPWIGPITVTRVLSSGPGRQDLKRRPSLGLRGLQIPNIHFWDLLLKNDCNIDFSTSKRIGTSN